MPTDVCELCRREAPTTEHHLIPRERRKKSEDFGPTARLCRDCHRKIHATWDNRTLARDYATIEKLAAAPELASYLKWIRKHPGSRYFGSAGRKR